MARVRARVGIRVGVGVRVPIRVRVRVRGEHAGALRRLVGEEVAQPQRHELGHLVGEW